MNKLISLAFTACVAFIASGSGVYAQWMVPVVSSCGSQSYTAGQSHLLTQDTSGKLCSSATGGGGGGGTSSNFGAAFPSAGTAAGAEYLSSPPTLTSGQMVALQTDVNGNLKVSGLSGSVSNASSGVATSSSNIGAASWLYGFNGTTWDQLRDTGSPNFALVIDDAASSNQLHSDLTSPPNVTVNGSNGALTGLTPGVAQTGTIVALNTDKTSVHGTALGAVVSNLGTLASGTPAAENVNAYIVGGAGSGGTALADNSAFTQSTTSETPIGCLAITSYTAATTGHATVVQCDTTGHPLVNPGTIASWGLMSGTTPGTAPTNTLIAGQIYNSSAPSPTTGQTLPLQSDSSGNLKVTGLGIAQGSASSGQTGSMVLGAATTSPPTDTTGDSWPLSMTVAGGLRIDVASQDGTALGTPVAWGSTPSGNVLSANVDCVTGCSGSVSPTDGAAFTAGATTFNDVGGQVGAATVTSGHMGAFAMLTNRDIMDDIDAVSGTALSNGTESYGTAFSSQTATVPRIDAFVTNTNANGSATSANSSPVVIASDQAAVAVKLNTTPTVANGSGVVAVAATTGGASTAGAIVPNNTTAVVVKASAGTLYGVQLSGIGSAPAYLKIYNATSATCGSGTPVKRLMIPAAATAANGGGSNISFGSAGIAFGTGITYCVTTGIGDADTTAPAASTFLVNIDYD